MSRIEVELFNAGTSEYILIGPIEREVGDKVAEEPWREAWRKNLSENLGFFSYLGWRPLEIVTSVLNFGIGC
jgi:hypothetical protein